MSNIQVETVPITHPKPTSPNWNKLRELILERAGKGMVKFGPGDEYLDIQTERTCYRVPLDILRNLDESGSSTLMAILNDRVEHPVLYTFTRVVGYYSNASNWNKSKIGELEDRQKGNYMPPETD
mgnify:CR=1 FL=1